MIIRYMSFKLKEPEFKEGFECVTIIYSNSLLILKAFNWQLTLILDLSILALSVYLSLHMASNLRQKTKLNYKSLNECEHLRLECRIQKLTPEVLESQFYVERHK